MKRYLSVVAVAILAATPFAMPTSGWAAPQALGLVASYGPVLLNCTSGECSAEFSTFCLQSERQAPASGTAYAPFGARGIRVVAKAQDGRETELDPARDIVINTSRGHVAVRITVEDSAFRRIAPIEVAVYVDRDVALKPIVVGRDDNPQSPQELALAGGPLRQLGTKAVDANTDRMSAARVANRMINLLPPTGPFSRDARAQVWNRAIADNMSLTPQAERFARNAFDLCDYALDAGANTSMRRCLQTQHDNLLNFLNSGYWKATGTGS